MKNTLIAEVRPDKDGKMVTRHVRADRSATGASKPLPSPSLPASGKKSVRRAFKPNDEQLCHAYYGIPVNNPDPDNWGIHVIGEPHPDLAAVPFTDEQQRHYQGDFYRFRANCIEYYSVMSVVKPYDAINLLHRGINSAEEAVEFLNNHGISHLAGDYGAYTDELLRNRIAPNTAMVYMNDIIDSGADPALAADWVKLCSQKSIIDKAAVIKDEMLSGKVSLDELKAVGVKNLAPDIKTVTKYIIHSKNDNNPDFTFQDIANVMSSEVDSISYEKSKQKAWHMKSEQEYARHIPARLAVTRFHGAKAGSAYNIATVLYERELERMQVAGAVDEKRLADLTHYVTSTTGMHSSRAVFDLLIDLHDSGVAADDLKNHIESADKKIPFTVILESAKAGIHSSVSGGWL